MKTIPFSVYARVNRHDIRRNMRDYIAQGGTRRDYIARKVAYWETVLDQWGIGCDISITDATRIVFGRQPQTEKATPCPS